MQYGNLYATRGVADQIEKDKQFEQEVLNALQRYTRYDWGDLCASDKAMNDAAAAGADCASGISYKRWCNMDNYRMGSQRNDDPLSKRVLIHGRRSA